MRTTRICRNSGVAVTINKGADDKAQPQRVGVGRIIPSKLARNKLKQGISPVHEYK